MSAGFVLTVHDYREASPGDRVILEHSFAGWLIPRERITDIEAAVEYGPLPQTAIASSRIDGDDLTVELEIPADAQRDESCIKATATTSLGRTCSKRFAIGIASPSRMPHAVQQPANQSSPRRSPKSQRHEGQARATSRDAGGGSAEPSEQTCPDCGESIVDCDCEGGE